MNKRNGLQKVIILLAAASLLSACRVANSSDKSSKAEESSVSSNSGESSSSSKSSSSTNKSSSSSSSSTSESSQVKESYSLDNSSLQSNPSTCSSHVLTDEIVKKATIIEKGIKRHSCANCGGFTEEYYYDLDEYTFEDRMFSYDGNERTLRIEGLLPYGCTVEYENNKLTDIGSKVAKAKIFDPEHNLLEEREATIAVVENTGLPNIRIITENGKDPDYKEKVEYTRMTLSMDGCDAKYTVGQPWSGGLRVRGNSTNQASVTKRAWRIKYDTAKNMLGLHDGNRYKSWVLLADFFDSSMFRNASAFTFGKSLFTKGGYYSSDYQHVNLYINNDGDADDGKDACRGIYLLAEQQKAEIGPDRVPIREAPENYTGTDIGYLVEIDGLVQTGQSDEDWTFSTGSSSGGGWGGWGGWGGQGGNSENSVNGVNITDKSYVVKTDCYAQAQVDYIKNYLVNVLKIFKQVCRGEKYQVLNKNNELIDSPYTTAYETLNSVIDLDSLFRMYVLQEFMKNYDVGWGSFYLYVDFSRTSTVKRLTFSAPWDFDLGEGNKTSGNGVKTNDNFLSSSSYANSMTEFNPWLYLLSQTDFFKPMFKRYYSCFANSGIYERTVEYINYEKVAFASAFNATYERWNLPTATNSGMSTRRYDTHEEAVSYLLNWYANRKTYLDSTWLD